MALGDGETVSFFVERDGAGGVDAIGDEAFILQDEREGHGEATGVRGGQEFFRIRAGALLETGFE